MEQVDSMNRLRGPGIHDARVVELHFLESDFLRVRLRGETTDRTVALDGVEMVGFQDFVSGTIISDIFVFAASGEPARTRIESWGILFGGNFHDEGLAKIIDETAEKYSMCLLVIFESSYGGRLTALCRSVR